MDLLLLSVSKCWPIATNVLPSAVFSPRWHPPRRTDAPMKALWLWSWRPVIHKGTLAFWNSLHPLANNSLRILKKLTRMKIKLSWWQLYRHWLLWGLSTQVGIVTTLGLDCLRHYNINIHRCSALLYSYVVLGAKWHDVNKPPFGKFSHFSTQANFPNNGLYHNGLSVKMWS